MSETAYPEGKAPPKIFGGEASPLPAVEAIRGLRNTLASLPFGLGAGLAEHADALLRTLYPEKKGGAGVVIRDTLGQEPGAGDAQDAIEAMLRARMKAIEDHSDDLRKRLAAVLDILRGESTRSVLLAVPIAQTCPVAKLAIEARQKVDEAANSFTRISNELRSEQRCNAALNEKFEKLLAAVSDERARHVAERASLNSKLQRLATGIHEAHAIIFLTRGANIERDENWRAEFMPLVEAVRVAKTSRPGPQPPETNQDTCAPAPGGALGTGLSVSYPSASDMLESAWGIIASANGGDWTGLRNDWVDAASAWRDQMPGCIARAREMEGRGPSKEALEAAGLRAMLQDKDRRLGELEDIFVRINAARTNLNAALEAAGEAVRK